MPMQNLNCQTLQISVILVLLITQKTHSSLSPQKAKLITHSISLVSIISNFACRGHLAMSGDIFVFHTRE
jgi:hypothetical protein